MTKVVARTSNHRDRHSLNSGRLTSSRPLGAARHLAIDPHSAVIRKQLDWVVEAAHRIFADPSEIEIAFDEGGERAGQHHASTQLFVETVDPPPPPHRTTPHPEL